MFKNQTISLVIPCYNEEKGVAEVIQTTPDIVDEILVVDNNSSDRTAEVAESLGATVVEEKRAGYGSAYKAGFKAAKGDIIVTLDGDATYPVIAVPYLVALLNQDALDFISVWRVHLNVASSAENFLRNYGNIVLNIFLTALFGIRLKDSQSGMWVFKKEVLESATIWLCTSCYECTVKCPREIKVTEIMYALKRRAIDEGAYSRRFPIPVLARQFRDMVLRDGRINEARLVLNLVLRTHPLGMFSMRKLGLGLLRTGRFSLRRDPIEGRHSLATLLEAVHRNGGARDGGART